MLGSAVHGMQLVLTGGSGAFSGGWGHCSLAWVLWPIALSVLHVLPLFIWFD